MSKRPSCDELCMDERQVKFFKFLFWKIGQMKFQNEKDKETIHHIEKRLESLRVVVKTQAERIAELEKNVITNIADNPITDITDNPNTNNSKEAKDSDTDTDLEVGEFDDVDFGSVDDGSSDE